MDNGDQRRAPTRSDNAAWDLIVESALPTVWATAMWQRLSPADAASVCESTLLALLDDFGPARCESASSFTATVRDLAAVECRRMKALNGRRATEQASAWRANARGRHS